MGVAIRKGAQNYAGMVFGVVHKLVRVKKKLPIPDSRSIYWQCWRVLYKL